MTTISEEKIQPEDDPRLHPVAEVEPPVEVPDFGTPLWSESTMDPSELSGLPKQWCLRHYGPFYTTCGLCIQEQILEVLMRISPNPVDQPPIDLEKLLAADVSLA